MQSTLTFVTVRTFLILRFHPRRMEPCTAVHRNQELFLLAGRQLHVELRLDQVEQVCGAAVIGRYGVQNCHS